MPDTFPALEQAFQPYQVLAAKAMLIAQATARFPTELRETRWVTEVAPLFLKLLPSEIRGIHMECGFAQPVGWNILSHTLGLISGFDEETPVPARMPHALYTPRYNYGGWVRIWRLSEAALPDREAVLGPLVSTYARMAVAGGAMEEIVRGVLGIPPVADLSVIAIRQALLKTDLFAAPWMVSVWTGPNGWVTQGVASRLLNGEAAPEQDCVADLVTRRYADQTPGFDEGGSLIFQSGPDMGVEAVIKGIEMALRLGYRLDLIWEPIHAAIDSWEDGVMGFGETPLMGFVIPGPVGHFTVGLQYDGVSTRIEGLAESDYVLFRGITGIDPALPLTPGNFEVLAQKGTPIFGRFASFAPATRPAE
jgi:hypothetical protein